MSYGDSRAISLIVKSTAPNLNVYLWNRRRVSLLTPWRKWKRYAHIRIGYTRFISNSKKHEYSFIQDHNKYLVLVFVRLNFTLVIVKHKKKKKRKQSLGFFLFSCKIASFQVLLFFFFSNIFTLCRYLRSLDYRVDWKRGENVVQIFWEWSFLRVIKWKYSNAFENYSQCKNHSQCNFHLWKDILKSNSQ